MSSIYQSIIFMFKLISYSPKTVLKTLKHQIKTDKSNIIETTILEKYTSKIKIFL